MVHKIKGKEIPFVGDPERSSEPIRHKQCQKCQEVHHWVTYKATFCPTHFFPSWEARTDGGRCLSSENAVDSSASTWPLFHYSSVLTPTAECYISSPHERREGSYLTYQQLWIRFIIFSSWYSLSPLHLAPRAPHSLAFSQPQWWLLFICFC